MATRMSYNELNSDEVNVAEIEAMVDLLKKRHGRCAYAIAHYFALEHETVGDDARSNNWYQVATLIRKRRFN